MKRNTWIWICVAVVAVAAITAVTLVLQGGGKPAPTHSPTMTPSPTSTTTATLPRSTYVSGSLAGWETATATSVAFAGAQVGEAAAGEVSFVIDAPSVKEPTAVAHTSVPVQAGETYRVSAKVRVLTDSPVEVGAVLQAGGLEIPFGTLTPEWTEISGDVVADGGEVSLTLRVHQPVTGLSIDEVSVALPGTDNLVSNGSFEDVSFTSRIVNEFLVMRTETATVAVVAAAGEATWKVSRADQIVTSGTYVSAGSVTGIPLVDLVQGYYTFEVTDSGGVTTTTPFAIVDGAVTTTDMRFGVGVHVEEPWYADAARYARSIGVAEARNDILWQLNELEKGVYDFDPRYAEGFDRLHANGIKVLGIVNYGNKLYGSEVTPDTPEAIAAYGRYAAAIAQRFDLVGLEVFNEFNHERFNSTGCGTDPSCYMPLLQSVHDNVRAVDPEIPIVAGSTANYDAAWFDGLWKDGGLAYADAISYHPYEIVNDPTALAGVIAASRDSMKTFGGGEKPIWITELGGTSYPAAQTVEQQADFLLKAAATAIGSGAEKFFWYDLVNDSEDPNSHEGNFGLFYRPIDGVAALPPKPSAFTYALLIDQLTGRDTVGQKPLGDGVTAYEFGSGSESVIVAWAKGQEATVEIPATEAIEVVAADGTTISVEPVDGVASVTITAAGAFIRTHATDGT